ncbi:DUF4360 domain-containing protein [Actinoplanes sp. NPDC026619]|uniref:DUF4360 domain-containing protein n=1 Tax=Actinoplanes sp. NPDC026619 TaxID=3155798 RepID=UPI0033F98D47
MLQVLTAGALFLSSLVGSPLTSPAKATPPPPDKMVIDVVGLNGTGCPGDSAEVLPALDNTAFTVLYSKYVAQAGSGSAPDEFRRNCQLALNVHVPSGYTYAIAKTDYRGYMRLVKGAWAYEQANYYFQGYSQTARSRHNFAGVYDGDWQVTDQVALESYSWAPCGEKRYLNINTELRIGTGSSDGKVLNMITMDSTDTALATVYHLAWKKC